MNEFLSGKTAVITGASGGLGRAMAVALAGAGINLALVARNPEKLRATLDAVRAAYPDAAAETYEVDVTSESQVADLAGTVEARFGRAQILINSAGVNLRKPMIEFTLDEWRWVIESNLTSVFLMSRAFVPQMQGTGYGRIINLTSIMSHVSLPGRTAYSSSKAALLGFNRALALELAADGITVVGISPGPFATEINAAVLNNPEANAQFLTRLPVGRWGDPPEVGRLALYLCSQDAGFITGTDIVIDGGWLAS